MFVTMQNREPEPDSTSAERKLRGLRDRTNSVSSSTLRKPLGKSRRAIRSSAVNKSRKCVAELQWQQILVHLKS